MPHGPVCAAQGRTCVHSLTGGSAVPLQHGVARHGGRGARYVVLGCEVYVCTMHPGYMP
jgi:hypothetical protein